MNYAHAIAVAILFVPSLAHADGDAAAGKKVFAKCASCHADKPGDNRYGPTLAGVVGRKAGTEPGYKYSSGLAASGLTWDANTLDKYLTAPGALVKGTKMPIGVPSAADRANVIAYLATLGG